MIISQYLKLKKLLNQLIAEAEKEALNEGVDITSEDFELLIQTLKERIIEDKGFTMEEYQEIKKQQKETKLKESQRPTILLPKEQIEEMLSEFRTELEVLSERLKSEEDKIISYEKLIGKPDIKKLAEDISQAKFDKHNKELSHISEQDIRKIAKSEIPKLPKDIEKIEEIDLELKHIQLDHVGIYEGLDSLKKDFKNIKIPTDYVRESVLEPSVKEIVAPDLNRILRSVQSQVYSVNKKFEDFANSENLWDKSGTTIIPHFVGDGIRTDDQLQLKDTTTYLTRDATFNMSFTDAVAGTKTLSELGLGGIGGDKTWVAPVIDKDLNTPPGGESDGDRYIVSAGIAGD